MFLCREHEDGKNELRCKQHFNDNSLSSCGSRGQCCCNVQISSEETFSDKSSEYASEDLDEKKQYATHDCDITNQNHS